MWLEIDETHKRIPDIQILQERSQHYTRDCFMIKFCGKLLVLCAAKRKLSVFIYVLICVTKLKDKRDYQFFVSVLMCVESEKKVRKILKGERDIYI